MTARNIVQKVKEVLCNHNWARKVEHDAVRNKLVEYRECIKCGRIG